MVWWGTYILRLSVLSRVATDSTDFGQLPPLRVSSQRCLHLRQPDVLTQFEEAKETIVSALLPPIKIMQVLPKRHTVSSDSTY